MAAETPASKPAKILYRPVGLASSLAAGAVAGALTKQVWKRVSPASSEDPPQALQSEYRLREVLLAAAIQGAIFSLVRALVNRGGARAFQRWTGEWPGD